MNDLVTVILAAGKGTRMKSSLPKCLHSIAQRPMISHVMEAAKTLSPKKQFIIIGPDMPEMSETIPSATFLVQKERLGTGHAVLQAKDPLKAHGGGLLILYGDNPLIRPQTLQKMIQSPADVTLLGFTPEDPARYGRIRLDENGAPAQIIEYKDATEQERQIPLCNSGFIYGNSSKIFDLLDLVTNDNASEEFYLTDIIELAYKKGLTTSCVQTSPEEVLGVNSKSELASVELLMQKRLQQMHLENGVTLLNPHTIFFSADTIIGADSIIEPHVFFGAEVSIGQNVHIKASSYLQKTTVSDNVSIGPFAHLRPGTLIETGAKIGNFVEVKNAHIKAGAKVNHLSYVGDAVLGERVNVGAGTITCNYDGYLKHQTTIGADTFIGSNTALVAPIKIGEGSVIGAGSTLTQDVTENSLAYTRASLTLEPQGGSAYHKKKSLQKKMLKEGH